MINRAIKLLMGRASWALFAACFCLLLMLASGSGAVAQAGQSARTATTGGAAAPDVTCPAGQCFTDVPSSSPFFSYINNLYMDSIVGGYPCGGSGEQCDPNNRPYYRPSNNVTRQQMSKFVDLGRRNIADAVGTSLVISSSANITIHAETISGGEAVKGECLQASTACYGVAGIAAAGDVGGYFLGGEGVYAQSGDPSRPGANIVSYGSTAYGAEVRGQSYRGEYVNAVTPGSYSLYVDRADTGVTDLYVNSGEEVTGNLIVDGSKTGYVVDIMQNVGDTPLEPGDVVVIVGSSAPVIGQIPVVTVRKTAQAYDTGVAGVVDQMMYVPDPATKAAYNKQEQDIGAARDAQDRAIAAAEAQGAKPDLSAIPVPEAAINDDTGNLHALPDAASAAPNTYLNVVTLGSYKAVKVDASFGPIHAGDLLTTSPHAGYAMKADNDKIKFGSVIGKALGDLNSGTGTVPVMVTLK